MFTVYAIVNCAIVSYFNCQVGFSTKSIRCGTSVVSNERKQALVIWRIGNYKGIKVAIRNIQCIPAMFTRDNLLELKAVTVICCIAWKEILPVWWMLFLANAAGLMPSAVPTRLTLKVLKQHYWTISILFDILVAGEFPAQMASNAENVMNTSLIKMLIQISNNDPVV